MVELKLWRTIKYFYHVLALAPILGSTLGARWDYIGIFSFLLVISIVLFLIIFFIDIPNVEKGIVKLTEKIEEKIFDR